MPISECFTVTPQAVAQRREVLETLGVIAALLPLAHAAAQLRASGVRLVGDELTRAALAQIARDGCEDAARVLANLFPRGHREVV